MGVASPSSSGGNCAWYDRVTPRCIDCGRFCRPRRSIRNGAAEYVCFDHATPRERALFEAWLKGDRDAPY